MNSCTKRLKKLDITKSGSSSWRAPSNIALVKYWGKKEVQIPCNPSVSFTLKNCFSETSLEWSPKEEGSLTYEFMFEGQSKKSFHSKLDQFFEKIIDYIPELNHYHFIINSKNSFPHSAGIASSASAMAALALNLVSFERSLGLDLNEEEFIQRSSFLARIGSGSASRSLFAEVACWGDHPTFGNDHYALSFSNELHSNFKNYRDSIVIVDDQEKAVSSRVGHALMNNHPFANERFTQAHANYSLCLSALKSGDTNSFIKIVEAEALSLHAMMMTSSESYMLMRPGTLQIIEEVRKFREQTSIPICFTLDAGPNVHILYPSDNLDVVMKWFNDKVKNFKVIHDELGNGPEMIQ
tara:strand:+ start:310899 stop:311957 length:1059 start_codon:yes stop_codon:yes gene_type:complete